MARSEYFHRAHIDGNGGPDAHQKRKEKHQGAHDFLLASLTDAGADNNNKLVRQ